jgi:hypothetical protein
MKVNCSVEVEEKFPSVTVRVTFELPSEVGVPEITPVTASNVSPAGRPLVASLVAALPPLVITWNLKGFPVRPVEAVLLVMTGPDGAA